MYHVPAWGERGGAGTELDVIFEAILLLVVSWGGLGGNMGVTGAWGSSMNEAGSELCASTGTFLATGEVE